MKKDNRIELNDAIDEQMRRNLLTKRNQAKFASKLRRWMTRNLGSRRTRAKMIEAYPCIVVKGVVVK